MKQHQKWLLQLFLLLTPLFSIAQEQYIISEEGDSLLVKEGQIKLPESRNNVSSSNTVILTYQIARTSSKSPKEPVFLLAGGPGGSWLNTARLRERFQEIQFYQQFSDVIIYDQRGAGRSIPNLDCREIIEPRQLTKLDQDQLNQAKYELAEACRDYWINQGIDLSAYTTEASAKDLDDLRRHLGYDKIILVGGSYGSHLGLSYIKQFEQHVASAILHGIEGPDHTLDLPSAMLNTLCRIMSTIEASEFYDRQLSGQTFLQLYRAYFDQLSDPAQKLAAQFLLTFKAGNRHQLTTWPDLMLDLYHGNTSFSDRVEEHLKTVSAPHAMNNMMDFSSWASESRLLEIKHDPAANILGPINHHFFAKQGVWPVEDLGEAFRANVHSDVPVLLIHGDWDLSTPIENAREVHRYLSNAELLEVEHGSHDAYYELLEECPPIFQILADFINGAPLDLPAQVSLPLDLPEVFEEEQITFWDAVIAGDTLQVGEALSRGAQLNLIDTRKNKNGRSAMNWAAWVDDVEMLEFLLARGANINQQNKSGYTPIHHAIENCSFHSFRYLLQQGADISIETSKGKLPMQTAKEKCIQAFKYLTK